VGRRREAAAATRSRREGSCGRAGLGEKWRHLRGFGLGGGELGHRRRQRSEETGERARAHVLGFWAAISFFSPFVHMIKARQSSP
jgi:hypothetical protein